MIFRRFWESREREYERVRVREGAKWSSWEQRRSKRVWGFAFLLVCIIAENSCISPFYSKMWTNQFLFLQDDVCIFLSPSHFLFFSFSFHSPFFLLSARISLETCFPMDVCCLFGKSCGQGWPWESGHDIISHWLRWRSTPKYEELWDGDGLWGWSNPLLAHITSHVRKYHLLSLSVRGGSGWPRGTCYTLSETISLSPSIQLVLFNLPF